LARLVVDRRSINEAPKISKRKPWIKANKKRETYGKIRLTNNVNIYFLATSYGCAYMITCIYHFVRG